MPSRSSTPMPAAVSRSSVRSGSISEIASTNVVLPTPNPPAIRILTGDSSWASVSYPGKVVPDSHEQVDVGRFGRFEGRPVMDQTPVRQLAEKDRHRGEADVHAGGDLGDGPP